MAHVSQFDPEVFFISLDSHFSNCAGSSCNHLPSVLSLVFSINSCPTKNNKNGKHFTERKSI